LKANQKLAAASLPTAIKGLLETEVMGIKAIQVTIDVTFAF
jgi:hypothetical protein